MHKCRYFCILRFFVNFFVIGTNILLTYAEIHYRPKHFPIPGLLFRDVPEIVCDAPHRVESGRPIPIFLMIKDANRFPINLDRISVLVTYRNGKQRFAEFPYANLKIDIPIWWDSINIEPETDGIVEINPVVVYIRGKNIFQCGADNYPGLSGKPLVVNVSADSFPGKKGWYHGDIHCHSYFTSDQVEFGAPMEAMVLSGFCMGLDWIAVTDHSYDLEKPVEDCEVNGTEIPRWYMAGNISKLLEPSFTVIPGEEISCRNSLGENCHLLALNSGKFIKGTGDSGKSIFNHKSEYSVKEAIVHCTEWGGMAFAAHPFENVSFLEKLVLGRGSWTIKDARSPGLIGLQIYNGVRDSGFDKGKSVWIQLLLEGYRVFISGGSDAHGDMNRKRAVNRPLLSLEENDENIYGKVRTVVRAASTEKRCILDALSEGGAILTDGPFMDISVVKDGKVYFIGEKSPLGEVNVKGDILSSAEFGEISDVRIIAGNLTDKNEKVILYHRESLKKYELNFECSFKSVNPSYVRAECMTLSGGLCITNPIWFG